MDYKKSNYNVEIETLEDGRKLIYNTYTGIFGIMDDKTQSIFNDIENINVSTGDTDDKVSKTIDIMTRAGYIINADKDELATIRIERARNRHRGSSLNLTIAPTMDCNMCCPYCYENKSQAVMTDETPRAINHFR